MEVDTQKDIEFYVSLVNHLGQKETDRVAPVIFTQDLSWMGWEARRSKKPKPFFYKIRNISGNLNLVHQRDLETNEDVLTKISRSIRFGWEFEQMSKVKVRLLSAENGAITTWISPKKNIPQDPDYPLDQINIAKKIDEETIWVKQLQGNFVHLEPSQTLEDLMLNIGEPFDSAQGKDDFGDWNMDEDETDNTKGQVYTEAIKQGYSSEELKRKRAELLGNTVGFSALNGPVQTSCGEISFGGRISGSIPPWCEACLGSDELRCKFCRRNLQRSEVNSHRCVC